jgi:carbon-monoxide dehydrogenase medium subunit
VAHPVIRNRGTTVGSIAHADVAGEMPTILAMCDGVVEVCGMSGSREIPWHDFFLGPLETSLSEDELATAVRFPRFPSGTGTAFLERARRHGDYALAGVGAAVTVTDGVVSGVRLGFVSVTDVPTVLDLSAAYAGQEPAAVDWASSADAVGDAVAPEDDIHATAAYRRMLAVELARLALTDAAGRAA